MSFYLANRNYKPNNKKMTTSLQARPYSQKTHECKFNSKGKRMSFTTFFKASFTIECALLLPLFFMVTMNILSLMIAMKTESEIQSKLHQKARSIAAYRYIDITEKELPIDIPTSFFTYAYVRSSLLKDLNMDKRNHSMIVMGGRGISFLRSLLQDEDNVDLIATYEIAAPFSMASYENFRLISRCRIHVWKGFQIQLNKEQERVYITPYGSVYHLHVDCKYLDLSVQSCRPFEIQGLRNKSGEKYQPCRECQKEIALWNFYYTDYGTAYHKSLDCIAIKRTIQVVEKKDVGTRTECKGCREQ